MTVDTSEMVAQWREAIARGGHRAYSIPVVEMVALLDALEAERERVRVLTAALAGMVGSEPPISDLTNGYPWAGCSYCYGPHYHSAYHKRMGTYRGEYGQESPPEPGEDAYAPFTEHTAECPWALARAALATAGGEGATT